MKKHDTASISDSGKGIKIITIILLLTASLYSSTLQNYKINEIYFNSDKKININKAVKYKLILDCKTGENFSYKKIRNSMENLYKTGLFSNIETEIKKLNGNKLNLFFAISYKYSINSIKIKKSRGIKKRDLLNSIFSLRKDTWFEESKIKPALQEIRNFLSSRGYFNPGIEYKIFKDNARSFVDIHFFLTPGKLTAINKTFLIVPNKKILLQTKIYFTDRKYIPYKFQKNIGKVKEMLKKRKYYFPVVKLEEIFLDKEKSKVDLNVTIKPGYRYEFKFLGIKSQINLISSIWEKKVFEKFAEKESKSRILYYLNNKGYLNAEIESLIKVEKLVKYITFKVKKNKKYKLGKITFTGNKSFTDSEMKKIIKTDDLLFNKYFWLRSKSLRLDQEVLRLFYYFKGFPFSKIFMQPNFFRKKVDINFIIDEGKKFTVDTILFNGNRNFKSDTLYALLETRSNGPFIQQILYEDIEKLIKFYYSRGFDTVEITPEVSPGTEKSILININEGNSYKLGNLIIIGASESQKKLIQKLFPIKTGYYFDQLKIEKFKSEIENSAIFNAIEIIKIKKPSDIIDTLIKITPDKSKYYGLGIGWEDKKGLRGTMEYQKRNIFNSYSALSTLFQLGKNVLRGVISYNTPYFFKRRIASELKIWADNEIFPSYSFNRFGLGESILKKLTLNSYVSASLSWYRTKLTDLEITPSGVDREDTPFNTTALYLSYVSEKRDNPFNPTRGNFFSSDLKIGIPISERDYSFIKFRWSFQQNFKFLKHGNLAFSIRNGLAYGDMSITERFFAGGPFSFRGAKIDRLGPTDPETNGPKGGNALMLFNLEATFPISIIPGDVVYYSLFADIGNVFERVSDFSLKGLKRSIGFSFKFKTEMGPVRLGVAWNIEKKPEGNFVLLIIGIGNVL